MPETPNKFIRTLYSASDYRSEYQTASFHASLTRNCMDGCPNIYDGMEGDRLRREEYCFDRLSESLKFPETDPNPDHSANLSLFHHRAVPPKLNSMGIK